VRRNHRNKIELLQELIFKTLAIKNLIQRNKEKALKAASDPKIGSLQLKIKKGSQEVKTPQENPAFNPKKDEIIQFPFIVVLSSSPENSVRNFYFLLFMDIDEP